MCANDEDETVIELKRLFIDTSVESGCKVASTTDEYINIKNERHNLIEKLLSYVPENKKKDVTEILSDISSTFNQQSSQEFDCVLGNLFDKIHMLPQLISYNNLKKYSKKTQN